MKKALLFFSLAIISLSAVMGQKVQVGIRGGLNLSSLVGADAINADFKAGVHIGPFVRVQLSDLVFFQPEILLSTKGFVQKGLYRAVYYYKFRQNIMYMDLPLMIGINATKNFGILAGLQPSFLITAKAKDHYETNPYVYDRTYINTTNFANIDLALLLGLQYKLDNGLDFGFRFSYGIPTVYNDPHFRANNLNMMLTVGYGIGK